MVGPEQDVGRAPEEADRPWEQTGEVRRDCMPHLARWFMLLAWSNVFAAVLSMAGVVFLYRPTIIWVPSSTGVVFAPGDGLLLLLAAPCIPLGLVSYALAGRHLAQMQAGLVDPSGARATTAAHQVALLAMVVGATAAVFAAPFLLP